MSRSGRPRADNRLAISARASATSGARLSLRDQCRIEARSRATSARTASRQRRQRSHDHRIGTPYLKTMKCSRISISLPQPIEPRTRMPPSSGTTLSTVMLAEPWNGFSTPPKLPTSQIETDTLLVWVHPAPTSGCRSRHDGGNPC